MVFLNLFHGRKHPDEQLDDWGSHGPIIGPVNVSMTYGTLKVYDSIWDHFEDLTMFDDLVYYNGIYYGDMEIIIPGDPIVESAAEKDREIHDYDQFLEQREKDYNFLKQQRDAKKQTHNHS